MISLKLIFTALIELIKKAASFIGGFGSLEYPVHIGRRYYVRETISK